MRRLLLILIIFTTPLAAQVRAPKKPANPSPAPRLKDGTPNLGPIEPNKGYWAPQQYQDYTAIAEPKDIPYQQWARELANYRKVETASKYDPQGFCLPPAGPRGIRMARSKNIFARKTICGKIVCPVIPAFILTADSVEHSLPLSRKEI